MSSVGVIVPTVVPAGSTAEAVLTVWNTSVLTGTTTPAPYTFTVSLYVWQGSTTIYLGSRQVLMSAGGSMVISLPFPVAAGLSGQANAIAQLQTTDGLTAIAQSPMTSFTIEAGKVMAQSFYPIDPVEVTPGTANAWTDVDVSAYVPAGATGVMLHLVNTAFAAYGVGLRKNGSTDKRSYSLYNSHVWAAIGVDASRIFEATVGHLTSVDIYLVGYTMSGVTFFTNAYDKSLSTTGAWTDIACHVEAPGAIGLIFEFTSPTSLTPFGIRMNGSSDARTASAYGHHPFSVIIGCDASQIVEGYIGDLYQDLWLVGYITGGCIFNLNATDVSLGPTGAWTDLTALPANSVMGFIEVSSSDIYNYALRKNGSSEDIYKTARKHPWAFVECDAAGVIEGKIETTAVDFFVVGYATRAAVGYLPRKRERRRLRLAPSFRFGK